MPCTSPGGWPTDGLTKNVHVWIRKIKTMLPWNLSGFPSFSWTFFMCLSKSVHSVGAQARKMWVESEQFEYHLWRTRMLRCVTAYSRTNSIDAKCSLSDYVEYLFGYSDTIVLFGPTHIQYLQNLAEHACHQQPRRRRAETKNSTKRTVAAILTTIYLAGAMNLVAYRSFLGWAEAQPRSISTLGTGMAFRPDSILHT